MIQAKDFRVENLVNFSYTRKKERLTRPVIITEIKQDYVMTLDKGLPLQLHYNGGSLEPIPLTPEILKKAGFRNKSDIEWWIEYESDLFICVSRSMAVSLSFDTEDFVDQQYTHIKFLHQLQNLYFALTGEELNIKL